MKLKETFLSRAAKLLQDEVATVFDLSWLRCCNTFSISQPRLAIDMPSSIG